MRKTIQPDELRDAAFRAIYRRGVSRAIIQRAYTKWQAGAQHAPCRFKDLGATVECSCPGCIERNCMAMFELVEKNAAAQYVCAQRGHLYPTVEVGVVCRRCGHSCTEEEVAIFRKSSNGLTHSPGGPSS